VIKDYHKFGGSNTEIYSLAVLEARSPKSRYQQGDAPPEGSREGFFFSCILASGGLVIFAIPLFIAASLQFLPPSSHGPSSLCVFPWSALPVCLHMVRLPCVSSHGLSSLCVFSWSVFPMCLHMVFLPYVSYHGLLCITDLPTLPQNLIST